MAKLNSSFYFQRTRRIIREEYLDSVLTNVLCWPVWTLTGTMSTGSEWTLTGTMSTGSEWTLTGSDQGGRCKGLTNATKAGSRGSENSVVTYPFKEKLIN